MAITLKTITGKIVIPGTTIGIRAKVTATPMTNAQALTFPIDDVMSWGPVEAVTDANGNLPASFKLPTNSAQQAQDLLWKFTAEPIDKHAGLPKSWLMGHYAIAGTGTIDLADLVGVDITAIPTAVYIDIQALIANAGTAATSASNSATTAAAAATTASGAADTAVNAAGLASEIAMGDAAAALAAADLDPGSDFRIQNDMRMEDTFGSSAATESGASTTAKITAATLGIAPGEHAVVLVPSTMRTAGVASPAPATDISITDRATLLDTRDDHATITNAAQKSGFHLARIFDANHVTPAVGGSDNAFTQAVEALLTAGSGSSSAPIHGENGALYVGAQRQVGSTRGMWGLNIVATSYEPTVATMPTYGLEIDLSNNGGTDATQSTPIDGIAVFAAGTNNSRFGLWVANSGTAKWLKGIMVSDQCSSVGIEISSGIPSGIYSQSPIVAAGTSVLVEDGAFRGAIAAGGGSAAWTAVGEFAAHQWYAHDGAKNPMSLEPNGTVTLRADVTTNNPTIQADGPGANHGLNIGTKGTGVLNFMNIPVTTSAPSAGAAAPPPATPAEYATVWFNGVARKVALY